MESDPTKMASSSDGVSQGLQIMRELQGRTTGPTRRSTKGQWTAEEDENLRKAVQRFKGKNWKKIAECFKDRTDVQCLHRWQKVLNPELVKGPWTKEEDEELVRLVEQLGPKKWSTIAQNLPGRIGKQCRERWHNHLNPAINKEAWSQQEELMLIQAHKAYGNKWAELTKFLPGRTDNAIKNHWNSSVKKKLDAYMASGLLAQFQDLPGVSHTNLSTPTSSKTQQCSEDDSIRKDVAEFEEISECSQSNNDDVGNAKYTGDQDHPDDMAKDNPPAGDSNPGKSLDSVQPHELENPSSHELRVESEFMHCIDVSGFSDDMAKAVVGEDSNPGNSLNSVQPHELENPSSQELRVESEFMRCIDVSGFTDDMAKTVVGEDSNHGNDLGNTKFIEQSYSRELEDPSSQDLRAGSEFMHCLDIADFNVSNLMVNSDPAHPPDGSLVLHVDDLNPQSYYQSLCMTSELPSCTFDGVSDQFNGLAVGNQECPGLIYENAPSNPHFLDNEGYVGPQDQVMDPTVEERGVLAYDPPHVSGFDIPFLSCDLIQGDLQHEFSPLGIRQLMMSSMNCFSPCRLWDSPSRDHGSPEAVLKSAAKTFSGTPSILKKRNRDLLSPLSEKRCGKKAERVSFFNSAKDFSPGDVMFDENNNRQLPSSSQRGYSGPFIDDKENMNPKADEIAQKDGGKSTTINFQVQKPLGVHLAQNLDDLFFSPDKVAAKSDTPKGPHGKISSLIPEASECENLSESLVSSRSVSGKRNKFGSRFALSSVPLETTVGTPTNDAVVRNSGLFGGTPFTKSLESPSAWKSPWFSFLPGPRVDTDITIEDIGYFTSPGERSYDALGLMKQVSERSASAYNDAREILGDETPDSILRKKFLEKGERSQQESNVLSERRVLDFSECGSPSARPSTGASFSSPSSYLLKSCR